VVSMPDAMQLPLIALFSHFLRLLQIVTGAWFGPRARQG
jgi:hypothetical protein